MKPSFLGFLFLVGTLVVLVTPLRYSTTIFVEYENGSQIKRDCYPNGEVVYCPTLEDAWEYIVTNVSIPKSVEIKIWRSCSTLETCESTPIILSAWLKFVNLSNITLVGSTKKVAILCKPNSITIGAGLDFKSVYGLVIRNLTLDGCGVSYKKSAINITDCVNVTLKSVGFRNSIGPGVTILQTKGLVEIGHFPRDMLTLSYYMIHNCTFFNSSNSITHREGGGMYLSFMMTNRSIVNISNCSFDQNRGFAGGGLLIDFHSSFENSVLITGCTFSKNIGTFHGGGVVIKYKLFATGNAIIFKDCKFDQNNASRGGGVSLVADGNNTLKFYNCTWYRNRAIITAAAAELASWALSGLASTKPIPVFDNCRFIRNEAQSIPFSISLSTAQYAPKGTLVATRYEVHFSGSVLFENNTGPSIYVCSSLIIFHSGMNATFINNSGINGGAMALRLSSSLQVNSNSTLLFANNSALLRGAAIYADSINDYLLSSKCFIHTGMYTSTENVTIAFLGNVAGVDAKSCLDFGRAVFATLCTYRGSKEQLPLNDTLERLANVTLKDSSDTESRMLMAGKQLFMGQRQFINSISGKEFNVSLEIQSQKQRCVDSVFRAFVLGSNNITIDPAYLYISTGTLKVYGSPGSNGMLVLERNGFPEVYLSADILLQECPPGYIIDENKENYSRHSDECSCAWNHEQAYQGILKCDSALFQASILHGFWAGYDSEPATPDNLFSAPCPRGFCSYSTTGYSAFHLLPNTASRSELEAFMCGTQRTGRLCGKCSDNHSVYFHSSEYKCGGNRHCRFGALFYIISEICPVTIIFITVMIFNINFTSGAVNGLFFLPKYLILLQLMQMELYIFLKVLTFSRKYINSFIGSLTWSSLESIACHFVYGRVQQHSIFWHSSM